jgi:hypothetical protein
MARQSQNNGRRRVVMVLVLVVAALLLFTGINRRRIVTPVRAEKVARQAKLSRSTALRRMRRRRPR